MPDIANAATLGPCRRKSRSVLSALKPEGYSRRSVDVRGGGSAISDPDVSSRLATSPRSAPAARSPSRLASSLSVARERTSKMRVRAMVVSGLSVIRSSGICGSDRHLALSVGSV